MFFMEQYVQLSLNCLCYAFLSGALCLVIWSTVNLYLYSASQDTYLSDLTSPLNRTTLPFSNPIAIQLRFSWTAKQVTYSKSNIHQNLVALLHSERPKLYTSLIFLDAFGLYGPPQSNEVNSKFTYMYCNLLWMPHTFLHQTFYLKSHWRYFCIWGQNIQNKLQFLSTLCLKVCEFGKKVQELRGKTRYVSIGHGCPRLVPWVNWYWLCQITRSIKADLYNTVQRENWGAMLAKKTFIYFAVKSKVWIQNKHVFTIAYSQHKSELWPWPSS